MLFRSLAFRPVTVTLTEVSPALPETVIFSAANAVVTSSESRSAPARRVETSFFIEPPLYSVISPTAMMSALTDPLLPKVISFSVSHTFTLLPLGAENVTSVFPLPDGA